MTKDGQRIQHRRRFLQTVAPLTVCGFAGCSSGNDQTDRSTPTRTTSPNTSSTQNTTATETPRENPDTIFVDASAAGSEEGTADEPLSSVQQAIKVASPGQTIQVRPGTYDEKLTTVRSGTAENPITITGPPEALVTGNHDDYGLVRIHHSHIHITGLSFEGLIESNPDRLRSYIDGQLIQTRPPTTSDEYLSDIVIAPHRIGYSRKSLIGLERTENAEIGPLRVTGLAGADYLVGPDSDHNGELLYIGTAPNNLGSDWHPWTEFDQTRDVRIHHLDNSAGHPHAEIVDLKPGTHDIVVEYVTDRNGGQVTDDASPNALSHDGHHNVVRWCDIGEAPIPVEFDAEYPEWTHTNSLYGNQLHDYSETAVAFEDDDTVGPSDQANLCGNRIKDTEDHPGAQDCPSDVPTSGDVGHTGGDSPW